MQRWRVITSILNDIQISAHALHFLFSSLPPFWPARAVMNSQFLKLISGDPYPTYILSAKWGPGYTDNSHTDKGRWDGAYLKDEYAIYFGYNNIYWPKKIGLSVTVSSVANIYLPISKTFFFLSIFPIDLWVKPYFMFSCKSWTLYLNDEQNAGGRLSIDKYFLCTGMLPY